MLIVFLPCDRDFDPVPEFDPINPADGCGKADHERDHGPETEAHRDIGQFHELKKAHHGAEEEDLHHDPRLHGIEGASGGDHPREGSPDRERDAEVEKGKEDDEGEEEDENEDRESDEVAALQPEPDDRLAGAHRHRVALCLHRDEGEKEHSEKENKPRESEGDGTLKALWAIPIKEVATSPAAGRLAFFDQFYLVERVTEMTRYFVALIPKARPSLAMKEIQERKGEVTRLPSGGR